MFNDSNINNANVFGDYAKLNDFAVGTAVMFEFISNFLIIVWLYHLKSVSMKNLKFYSILGLSALLVLGACKKEEITEDPGTGGESPVLTLSQTTLTVSVEGGVASVAYQVSNPVDGASVSVDSGM